MLNTIFKIQIHHSYFQSGELNNSQLIPLGKTADLINHYQLLFNSINGSSSLFAFYRGSSESMIESMVNYMQNQPMEFRLKYEGPNLINISDFPLDWCGHLEFSSQIKDSDNQLKIQFKQTALPYEHSIAKLLIYFKDLSSIDPTEFYINFPVRSTHWRYYVFNSEKNKTEKLQIKDHSGIEFKEVNPKKFPNGEEALSFISGEKVYIQKEIRDEHLSLIDNIHPKNTFQASSSFKKVLLDYLPLPSTDKITATIDENNVQVYSDAYIYI